MKNLQFGRFVHWCCWFWRCRRKSIGKLEECCAKDFNLIIQRWELFVWNGWWKSLSSKLVHCISSTWPNFSSIWLILHRFTKLYKGFCECVNFVLMLLDNTWSNHHIVCKP
jgi:hypothetical protein